MMKSKEFSPNVLLEIVERKDVLFSPIHLGGIVDGKREITERSQAVVLKSILINFLFRFLSGQFWHVLSEAQLVLSSHSKPKTFKG